MRVAVAKSLRVGPGDSVVVRGRLPASSGLGRLYVFAKEGDTPFAPYVQSVADILHTNGRPPMLSPLSLRLVKASPTRELSFVSDIDGYVCVVQEVDTSDDPLAEVRVKCRINPELGRWARLGRWLQQLLPSPTFT